MDRDPDIFFEEDDYHHPVAIWVDEAKIEIGYPVAAIQHWSDVRVKIDNVHLRTIEDLLAFPKVTTQSDYARKCQLAISKYIIKRDLDKALTEE